MSVIYEIIVDLSYLRTASARTRKQRPKRFVRWILRPLIMAPFIGAWWYAAATDADWIYIAKFGAIGSIVGGIVGGGVGAIVGHMLLQRRLRQAAKAVPKVTATLADDAITIIDPMATSTVQWSAYERAVRYPDGILLIKGRLLMRWLPDASLKEGTPQRATELVRAKLPLKTTQ